MPYDEGGRLSELHDLAGDMEREDTAEGVRVRARVPAAAVPRFERFAVNGALAREAASSRRLSAGRAAAGARARRRRRLRPPRRRGGVARRRASGPAWAPASPWRSPTGTPAWCCRVRACAARHGIALVNAPGLIDSGYRGEVRVLLLNTDRRGAFEVAVGDRIAQLVLVRPEAPELEEAEELDETARGAGRLRLQRPLRPTRQRGQALARARSPGS